MNNIETNESTREFFTEQQLRDWPEYFDMANEKLPNGEKLICRFGDGQPGICFVMDDDNINCTWTEDTDVIDGVKTTVRSIGGLFWISKKKTSCFRPMLNEPYHELIMFKGSPEYYDKHVKGNYTYSRYTNGIIYIISEVIV